MAAFLLRVRPLDTGASVILFLPEISASGNRAYKPVIPLWVKVKGTAILRLGTSGAKEPSCSSSQGKRLLCILNQYWDNVFANAITDLLRLLPLFYPFQRRSLYPPTVKNPRLYHFLQEAHLSDGELMMKQT